MKHAGLEDGETSVFLWMCREWSGSGVVGGQFTRDGFPSIARKRILADLLVMGAGEIGDLDGRVEKKNEKGKR